MRMGLVLALKCCTRWNLLFILALALAGCGGGGGGSSNPTTSAPPVTSPPASTQPSVTFNTGNLALSYNNTGTTFDLENETIAFTVADLGSASLSTRTTVSGRLFDEWSVRWTSSTAAKVHLVVRNPRTMGAGTYTGAVQVDVCLDASCQQIAIGGSRTIAVTYVVTGNASPATQVNWSGSFNYGAELFTNDTNPQRTTLNLGASYMPYEGVYLRRTASVTGMITSVDFQQTQIISSVVSPAAARLEITVKSPASLGSGFFTDTMQFAVCFDAACNSPVPGGGFTLSVDFMITATEGVEFTRRALSPDNGATEVVWSPGDQSLYLASSLYAANGVAPSITKINPLTAIAGPTVTLAGENLEHLAVTPDGSYLYVGSKNNPVVRRLQLPALTPGISVPLGSSTYLVNDFGMVPGFPQSFVVATKNGSSNGGVYVYDNTAVRPNSVQAPLAQGFESARWLVPDTAPGTFISVNYGPSQPVVHTLDRLTVDASGISTSAATTFPDVDGALYWPKPQRAGSKLYLLDGSILDATTGVRLNKLPGNFGTSYALLADQANGRILVWTQQRGRDVVLSYDMATLELLAIVRVYGTSLFPPSALGRSMTLWGTNGLALTDGNQLIVLSGSFFSTYRGDPTM